MKQHLAILTKRLFFGVMLFLLVGFGNSARATHYAAADLYLDYIGTGPNDLKYRVTLVLYKGCDSTSTSSLSTTTAFVNVTSTCATYGGLTLSRLSGPDTLDQLCPNFAPQNACRIPTSPFPAFVRVIYQNEVTLPVACTDWKVSWQGCDRNWQILNIITQPPSTECLFIEAELNNVFKHDNSTPRFMVDPIPYLCINQPSFFLNGPLDPDNDSMIVTNVQPLTTTTGIIPYQGAFSLANPLASTTGYTLNPNTGTALFTPSAQGRFVLAFEATDYDRATGIQVSKVRRDVQVSVVNCNAAPPFIDTIPQNLLGGNWVPTPPSSGFILACPGVPLSFNVSAQSNSLSNAIYLTSSHQTIIPAAGFTVVGDGGPNPVGTFTWTPTGADLGDYTIIFTAKDSTCDLNQPVILKNFFVAFIKVLPGVDAGPDGRICAIGGSAWQFNVSGPPTAKYIWTALDGSEPIGLSDDTSANPTAKPPYSFTYIVTAPNILSSCKNRDTISVYIDTSNSVEAIPGEAVLCRPGYFMLDAEGKGLPPLANVQCGTVDIKNCVKEDTLVVTSQFTGGTPVASSMFTPFPASRTAKMQFLLTKSDLYAYGIRAGTIRGLAFDVTAPTSPAGHVYDNFTISIACTDRTTLSAATGGLETMMTQVYSASGVPVFMGWNQFTFDTPYSHDSTKSLIVEVCYSNSTQATTAATVNAVNTSTMQMAYTYANTGTASICQDPAISVATQYYNARPNIRLNYCPTDPVPFDYTWYPGSFLSDSTQKSPLAYLSETTKYYVKTIGRNGCVVVDSVTINVPIHNYTVWPKDTTMCYGSKFKMIASGDFTTIKWYETNSFGQATNISCDDCKEPIATAKEHTIYKAVLTDKDGCSDTFTVNVQVKPLPEVNIVNIDTTLKYGQSIQLLASGAFLYSWTPIASLTNPNIVNPVATPTEPTTYYLTGLAENGCRNVDSIHVDIDYRDNLFVPSAFTPNGDGKNDVFRVTNITFQKLQEFRVFNRWGQEIFSTTDARKGWDGGWKGVPQDMGAYQYLIRVAYPDGFIETYKGDVTLVR